MNYIDMPLIKRVSDIQFSFRDPEYFILYDRRNHFLKYDQRELRNILENLIESFELK